jgi:hypothetical protein
LKFKLIQNYTWLRDNQRNLLLIIIDEKRGTNKCLTLYQSVLESKVSVTNQV